MSPIHIQNVTQLLGPPCLWLLLDFVAAGKDLGIGWPPKCLPVLHRYFNAQVYAGVLSMSIQKPSGSTGHKDQGECTLYCCFWWNKLINMGFNGIFSILRPNLRKPHYRCFFAMADYKNNSVWIRIKFTSINWPSP